MDFDGLRLDVGSILLSCHLDTQSVARGHSCPKD
jgi:hypothetical protein